MKNKLLSPKLPLSKFEKVFCILYGGVLPLYMLVMLFASSDYNPLLLLAGDDPGALGTVQFEDITMGWLWGMLFLIGNTLFLSVALILYWVGGNAKRTKTLLRIVIIGSLIEYYHRYFQMLINPNPSDEITFVWVSQGTLKFVLYFGIFFVFYRKVSKRSKEAQIPPAVPSDSLEKQLQELEALKAKNLLTEEEYSSKRSAILS